jgi:hypothetical protein
MPRQCLFCGGNGPLTSEHLIGRWTARFTDTEQRDIFQRSDREGELPRREDQRRWRARAYDRQARIVCKDCNTGWMSEMERAVSRLLDPAALVGRLLGRAEQTLLATWAMKTALTMNAAQPPDQRTIPVETARLFGRSIESPAGTYIWIASYTGSKDQIPAYAGLGIDLDDRQDNRRGWRDLSIITFVVGPFVFQVFSVMPALGEVQLRRTPEARITQLWPIEQPASWRPSPGFDAPGVVRFAEEIPASLRGAIVVSEPAAAPE